MKRLTFPASSNDYLFKILMKVSVIIPVYNNAKLTKQCLESIFAVGAQVDFEVIVVDNGSSDETAKILTALSGKILTIQNERNLGFAKACNQGAKQARGKFVVFLNNDTIVTDGWLDQLVATMESGTEIGAVGAKLIYPNQTIQHAGVVFAANSLPYNIYKGEKKDSPLVNKNKEYQAVTGACLLTAKAFFQEVDGFDENYQNGLEDIDFCFKLRASGKKIIYCADSVVLHYESMTEGRGGFLENNERFFLQKWRGKIKIDDRQHLEKDGYLKDKLTVATLIEVRDNELERLNKELATVKSLFFWRGIKLYLRFKSWLKKK